MRPIDADALEYESGTDPKDPTSDMAYIRYEDIEKAPTLDGADIEPEYAKLTHGHWIKLAIHSDAYRCFKCSACEEHTYLFQKDHCNYDFCPNCGACMDEGTEPPPVSKSATPIIHHYSNRGDNNE